MRKVWVLTCISLLLLSACGHGAAQLWDNTVGQQVGEELERGGGTVQPLSEQELAEWLERMDERLITSQNRFALDIYHQLREEETENLFLSPFSIALALTLAYNGADAETKQELADVLHVQDLSVEDVNAAYKLLVQTLGRLDQEVELQIANSLWAREGVELKAGYLQRVVESYAADVNALDFHQPQAAERINAWVAEQTNEKIEQIIEQIDPQAVLYLINAIYFLGEWSEPFDEQLTREDHFYLADGGKVRVPFMQQRGSFAYLQKENFEAISLPYGNGSFSMDIFLPQEESDLTEFEQLLTAENWEAWLSEFRWEHGELRLPRFALEYEVSLKDALQALGMEVPFDPGRADFGQLTETPVWVGDVRHKAYLEVDERGTEAAAVTVVEMPTSAPLSTLDMTVDRPFFFVIRERHTGSILFMGSVENPLE